MRYVKLQRNACGVGFFSYFITVLAGIEFCLKHKLIPTIDLGRYRNFLSEEENINIWDIYFKQPFAEEREQELDLDILFNLSDLSFNSSFLNNKKKIEKWRDIVKQYIHLEPSTAEYVNDFIAIHCPRPQKTLGVLCRGTDYTNLCPPLHPVQPTVEDIIKVVSRIVEEHQYESIYLATEDANIYEKLKAYFGNIIGAADARRYRDTGNLYLYDFCHKKQSFDEKNWKH